jgi:corrinoid protein of di/trimethylamine methyltransferase
MLDEAAIMETLHQAILDGDEKISAAMARQWLERGSDPLRLINECGTPAIREVGDRFGKFEIFLPELILSADAMQAVMDILMVEITKSGGAGIKKGTVVIGTVQGDIHDIGKNLVAALLGTNGFEVHNVGTNYPSKEFAKKAQEVGADIVALSALMSTSAYYQQDVIDFLSEAGLRGRYFVVIGGGPVTPEWAQQIGADGYGRTATDAVEACLKLMEMGRGEKLTEPVVMGWGNNE